MKLKRERVGPGCSCGLHNDRLTPPFSTLHGAFFSENTAAGSAFRSLTGNHRAKASR
jgi:hypothetical protein